MGNCDGYPSQIWCRKTFIEIWISSKTKRVLIISNHVSLRGHLTKRNKITTKLKSEGKITRNCRLVSKVHRYRRQRKHIYTENAKIKSNVLSTPRRFTRRLVLKEKCTEKDWVLIKYARYKHPPLLLFIFGSCMQCPCLTNARNVYHIDIPVHHNTVQFSKINIRFPI